MEVGNGRFLEEISEETGLVRAMEEAEGSPFVSRDEVMRILASAALTPDPSPGGPGGRLGEGI